jgi:hypothetical protein
MHFLIDFWVRQKWETAKKYGPKSAPLQNYNQLCIQKKGYRSRRRWTSRQPVENRYHRLCIPIQLRKNKRVESDFFEFRYENYKKFEKLRKLKKLNLVKTIRKNERFFFCCIKSERALQVRKGLVRSTTRGKMISIQNQQTIFLNWWRVVSIK